MTQPPREAWRVEMVEQETRQGIVHFEYVIREGTREPFLLNNHRAQIRESHMRVVSGPNGGRMHVSGAEVTGLDLEEFMATSPEAYRWVDKDRQGRWRDDRGRVLQPYLFASGAWAGGVIEELDPQWQRETYTLPISAQVETVINRYMKRALDRGWTGDRRGTTLNLKVSASADDAFQATDDSVNITGTEHISDASTEHFGFRWQNVTIGAATIDNAIFSVMVFATGLSDTVDEPNHRVRGHDDDNAAAFTTASNNIDSRTRTTANLGWADTDLGTASGGAMEEWGASVSGGAGASVEGVVQEIIDRAGWTSGNSIVFIVEQPSTQGTRDLGLGMYDGDSAHGAELDIDYTAAGGGGTAIKDIIGGGFILFPR